jgi:2-polyprenyl-6-hydroxyphenyl methylase / 3-demethylubiquinone-9 3-methyltransferase
LNDPRQKTYADDHWLKSADPEKGLQKYLEQQNKAYSRVKNAFIQELMGDLEGKRVMDYGCGAGFFSVYAAQSGAAKVVGVDAEESALAIARHFSRVQGVDHVCSFVRSPRFPSSLGRNVFDVILMKDVIEHVPDDQELLYAAAEAIVPGGKLIVSTQNALSLNYLLQGTYNRNWLGDKDWYGWDPTHIRFYTPMGLEGKLKEAGFRAASWRSVYLIPYKLPGIPGSGKQFLRLDALSWVDRRLGAIFPYNRLGWNIIVSASASPLVPGRVGAPSPVGKGMPPEPVLLARNMVRSAPSPLGRRTAG